MITWALKNDDLYLDANNNIAIWREELHVLEQQVINELQTFLGEVFTDNRVGVDFYGIIFNGRLPLQDKQQELSRVILSIQGVLKITEFTFELDKPNRSAKYAITIETTAGVLQLEDMGVEF